MAHAYECGKETFGSVKLWEFLDKLSEYGLLIRFFLAELVVDSNPVCVLHQDESVGTLRILDDTNYKNSPVLYLSTLSPGFWSSYFCKYFYKRYVTSRKTYK